MTSDKAQVVFMVDTSLPKNDVGSLEQYYRSLCLATLRILLYLSQFPIREHLNRVLWNFKLFNSELAEKSAKTWQFHENRSEHVERFFQQLHERLKQSEESSTAMQSNHVRRKNTTHKPIRLVYNALAAVIQDFIWDAPEIMSPIRPMKRGRVVRSKAAAAASSSLTAKESDCDKNMVIILSSCPASDQEMRKFCYGPSIIEEGSQVPVAVATIAEQLLPPALLTQLSSKGIAVHWVHTGGGALIEAGDADKVS
jgi:DNA segregation ATPase FtsK/SpoIIIE-like protein